MLRKLIAQTEQGAKDMKKGIIASVFTSLSLMLPMGLLLMLVMQLLQPLLGYSERDHHHGRGGHLHGGPGNTVEGLCHCVPGCGVV